MKREELREYAEIVLGAVLVVSFLFSITFLAAIMQG